MKEKDIVRATVTAVHDYGLEIEVEGRPGFIQPIEVSWEERVTPREVVTRGDCVDVYVYAITAERFYASIKMAHPERNVWADPRTHEVGSIHTGTLEDVNDWGAKVRLRSGATGMILLDQFPGSYARGQNLEVEIVDADASSRKLVLKPIGPGRASGT